VQKVNKLGVKVVKKGAESKRKGEQKVKQKGVRRVEVGV